MKALAILTLCLLFTFQATTQHESKYDLRIGIGSSILGTGDLVTTMMENELNIKFNNYFTGAVGLAFANAKGYNRGATFWQGNGNLFISPFRNNRNYDLRLGGGFTVYTIEDYYPSLIERIDGIVVDIDYAFQNRQAFGFSIIVENTIAISQKMVLGLKLFTQPYSNYDINSGVMLKLGVRI